MLRHVSPLSWVWTVAVTGMGAAGVLRVSAPQGAQSPQGLLQLYLCLFHSGKVSKTRKEASATDFLQASTRLLALSSSAHWLAHSFTQILSECPPRMSACSALGPRTRRFSAVYSTLTVIMK